MTDLIESEDELLDPQPSPAAAAPRHRLAAALYRLRERTPLGSAREADPERRRRRALGGLVAVALVAGAAAGGVAVHSHDVAHAQARTRDRTLLHLLGGTATLTFAPTDSGANGFGAPTNEQAPLTTDFTIALRNDGAKPLEVTGVGISVPGVEVLAPAPHVTLPPGDSEALTSKVAVHCTAADLPRYPSGTTVTVRTPAAGGKPAGSATTVPLTFDAGRPAERPDAESSAEDTPFGVVYLGERADALGTYSTGSFYQLCGEVLATIPPRVSATALPGSPTPQNPVIRYTLHIDDDALVPQMAVTLAQPPAVPGLSAQTDLAGPRQIGSEGLDVNVTDRVTDCDAFGDYLTPRGGATAAAAALDAATPVGLQPADPRFQTAPKPLYQMAGAVFDGLTPGTADLQSTLLTQLAAVCPEL